MNHLLHETSPYLRQHANNPVDWYPWGPEALERSRQFDRPIFLSIGYSACHWCHVMEHESFENDDVARILNEHFVSIKVDREERPDLDQIYMTAVQMMTGQGGWPMSVFLTPDLKPFYGGTYFPPDDHYGRPGFKRVLLAIAEAFHTKSDEVKQSAEQLLSIISQTEAFAGRGRDVSPVVLQAGVDAIVRSAEKMFDAENGGCGSAPKFPHSSAIDVVLDRYARRGTRLRDLTGHTLADMATGQPGRSPKRRRSCAAMSLPPRCCATTSTRSARCTTTTRRTCCTCAARSKRSRRSWARARRKRQRH